MKSFLTKSIIAIGLALTTPIVSHAKPVIEKSYSYFTVRGTTPETLERNLLQRGPFIPSTGKRHAGAAHIKFDAKFNITATSKKCKIEEATVFLKTKLILPRWADQRRSSKALQFMWGIIEKDILRHEEKHANIAVKTAQKLDKSLNRLSARSCEKLKQKIDKTMNKILKNHTKSQNRFDRSEAHGFERRIKKLVKKELRNIRD